MLWKDARRMTAKVFLKSLLSASAALTFPGNAQAPAETKQEPGALAQFLQSRARDTATTLLEEVQLLDAAVDQWAIENNKRAGAMPTPQDLAVYVKEGTRLHKELAAGRLNDALGNPMTLRGVDSVPLIAKATVEKFAAVAEPGFWDPYYEGPELSTVPPPPPAPANPVTKAELQITAARLLEEMRKIEVAMDQWALENLKPDGAQPRTQDLLPYIKRGTRLHGELTAGRLNDSLGNSITLPPYGQMPTISKATAEKLSGVAPADFWGAYITK